MTQKIALITNDVETTSIINHQLSDSTAEYVYKQGLPRLLSLYERYDVKTTFFFTAHIAKLIPDVVRMVLPYGHEVGSHGYSHRPEDSFDVLSIESQREHLVNSKKILEDIAGTEVISFRAPAMRVQAVTASLLVDAGYRIDSSVSSQRMDIFMSFGVINKLNWLFAPRLPYFTATNNIFRIGESNLLEIPVSALVLPYISTLMRMSPGLLAAIRNILAAETKINNRPFVFLTHPNEFIDEERHTNAVKRRSSNYFSYLLGDLLRHKLKIRNLGEEGLKYLKRELIFFRDHDYKFVTMRDYRSELINRSAE